MPPEGLEQTPNSSGNTGVRSQSGAKSDALPGNSTAAAVAVAGNRNEGEGADEGGRLDKLAAALLTLSPAERERLAAMLTAHQAEGKAAKPL